MPVRDAAMVHHSPGCCVLCSSCRAVGGVLRLLPLRLAPHWGRVRVRCSALPDCAPRGVRSRPRRGRAKCGGLLAGRVLRWGRGWAFGPRSLRCDRGPLSTRALTVGEHANGTCGVVHPAGLEPACPWATPFEGVVYPGSTTDACSPCLLVKGTDCAGDVQRVAVVIVRSLPVLEGPVPCWCRVASVGTCCPTYLPRALCSPRSLARVSGGGARGSKSSCRLHVKVPPR